jgi:hypothetical protein
MKTQKQLYFQFKGAFTEGIVYFKTLDNKWHKMTDSTKQMRGKPAIKALTITVDLSYTQLEEEEIPFYKF